MSEAREIVATCEGLGVELWLDGEQLRFRAPTGVMTAERLGMLREHKPAIIALLRDEEALRTITPDPGHRYDPFPLTDIQAAYVIGRSPGVPYGGLGCHGYGELHVRSLDRERLQAAWDTLLRRHDALRLVVDGNGLQRVLPEPVSFPIPVEQVRGTAAFAETVAARRALMSHRVYDPQRWPLFDLAVTAGDEESVLHFSIDFLIGDFVSLQVILGELEREYAEPGSAGAAPLVTFRDCVLARQAMAASRRRARDEQYWRERLDAIPPGPELPTRQPDRAEPRFGRLATGLSGERWSAFKQRAGQAGLTVNAAVLAAYAEVVRRWSSQPRFTLSLTVLARPDGHPDVPRVVGDFTTVELLAVDAGVAKDLRGRALAMQATLADDLEHNLYGGIDVIRELRRRDPASAPMFPLVFTSSLGVRGGSPLRDLSTLRLGYGISQTPQVWLDCQVMETAEGLSVSWDHREGVFQAGVVEAMFAAFSGLLDDMATGDDVWLAEDPVRLPATQLARRPVAAAEPVTSEPVTSEPVTAEAVTGEPVTGGALLHEAFVRIAREDPARTAVVTPARSYSYGDLLGTAAAVAEALIGAGCAPGSLVAIEMDKGWEQIPAVVGTLLAGCGYVPVDTNQPPARRRRILDNVGASHVLTQSWVRDPDPTTITVDTLAPAAMPALPTGGASDTAYVMYTSGTTGTPKGVVIRHSAVVNTIVDVNERFEVGPDSAVLGLASLGFDLSVFDIFGPLSVGGRLVLPAADRRNDPAHWARLMTEHAVTHWSSVPAQLDMLLSYVESVPDLRFDSLRQVLLSGDWVAPALQPRTAARAPHAKVFSLGGATEASIWSIVHPMDHLDPAAATVPYGRPLRHQSVLVLDDELRPVPDLVAGELYIGGVGLADGYHGDEALTASRFVRHPRTGERLYRTGDLGRYLPTGDIEFLGRRDSQVKIRGHRVELGEIEAVLDAHPSVGSSIVVAHGTGASRQLTAFVQPAVVAGTPAALDLAEELGVRAVDGAAELRRSIDTGQMLAFARELDATGLAQMLATLREAGLFQTPVDEHSLTEILDTARVAPRHRRLVRRWVAALLHNGLLHRNPDTGRYSRLVDADHTTVEAGWQRVSQLMDGVERRTELVDYFRTTARCLPELVRGEVDPLVQLFPAGRTDIHEVAYNGIFLSHYLNQILVGIASSIATSPLAPLRVLEIGAGVGGTSIELIPALAPYGVSYTFTDVSRFFLNNAQERFAGYGFIDYQLLDINADYWSQGLRPNSCSLIVCANVLHYARDIREALARIRELLVPGGWLLFIEATHDNYQIMTSMEFLFDERSGDFRDVRAEHGQTFVSVSQWSDALTAAGADSFCCLPQHDPITDGMGMHVFAARFKSGLQPVRRAELQEHLLQQLPDHMLPAQLYVLDQLPLTGNGKADRALLASRAAAGPAGVRTSGAVEPAVGAVETALAGIFAAKLDRASVGRHELFYDLGGDSLLAAQIAAAIRTDIPEAANVPFDRLLRVIFDNASVARLATEIESADGTPEGSHEQVAELVTLAEGRGTPTVLVHDGTGGLGVYAPLVAQLAGTGPILGAQVKDVQRYCEIDGELLVERLAEHYTRLLVDAGHLRVRLVGHHFGGLVALELARQLTEAGFVVERLVVVGGVPPWSTVDADLERWFARASAAGDTTGPVGDELRVFAHSTRSASGWSLLPYAGDVTVICLVDDPRWPSARADVESYWGDVCLGELTVVEAAGDYFAFDAGVVTSALAEAP